MSYTRFVIVGQERTGSNLLQLLLASHRNALSYGEIFNSAEEVRKTFRTIARPPAYDEDPISYLESQIYKDYLDHVKAVGFKLFYSHARNNDWQAVWEYLRNSKVKIIHLKRKNLLDRYLSHQLALRSNRWIALKEENSNYNEPIILDPQDCFQSFHRSLGHQQQVDNFFEDNPKLEVIYETLSDNFIEECARIQQFLGLAYQDLSSKTVKQRNRKKTEIIANYHILRQQLLFGLANSKEWAKEEWLAFFEDE
jgi:LPS sulfotransferase NodH